MKEDPIIQELRTIRREIEKECGETNRGYAERVRQIDARYVSRLVRLGPKPLVRAAYQVAEAGGTYDVGPNPNPDNGGGECG